MSCFGFSYRLQAPNYATREIPSATLLTDIYNLYHQELWGWWYVCCKHFLQKLHSTENICYLKCYTVYPTTVITCCNFVLFTWSHVKCQFLLPRAIHLWMQSKWYHRTYHQYHRMVSVRINQIMYEPKQRAIQISFSLCWSEYFHYRENNFIISW